MKIKYYNYMGYNEPNLISIAYRYREGRPWHIYEGASYDIEGEVDLQELIQEVMGEQKVSRKNIRVVRPRYIVFNIVKGNE